MTDEALAIVQAQLCMLSELALEIEGLDAFVARIESAPVVEGRDLRELAVAAAEFQRVVLRQIDRAIGADPSSA